MAKALGVGGIFFNSVVPEKLYQWYERWLGFGAEPGSGFAFPHQDMPKGRVTVWSAFEFNSWKINIRLGGNPSSCRKVG